jgi:hypothetical protein
VKCLTQPQTTICLLITPAAPLKYLG